MDYQNLRRIEAQRNLKRPEPRDGELPIRPSVKPAERPTIIAQHAIQVRLTKNPIVIEPLTEGGAAAVMWPGYWLEVDGRLQAYFKDHDDAYRTFVAAAFLHN
jgi:hypothetical protein